MSPLRDLARVVARSVLMLPLLAMPAAAQPAGAAAGPVIPATSLPSYWIYATHVGDKLLTTTLEWEGGSEEFDGAPAEFVQQLGMREAARDHMRRYYRATADGVYSVGWIGDAEDEMVTEVGSLPDTPELLLPIPFETGKKAAIRSSSTLIADGKPAFRVDTDGEVEVGARKKASVPAGTFDCTVVRTTTTVKMTFLDPSLAGGYTLARHTSVACYAAEVGLVKQATTSETTTHFKNVAPSTTTNRSVMTLSKYQVPRQPWMMRAIGLVPAPSQGGQP